MKEQQNDISRLVAAFQCYVGTRRSDGHRLVFPETEVGDGEAVVKSVRPLSRAAVGPVSCDFLYGVGSVVAGASCRSEDCREAMQNRFISVVVRVWEQI